MKQSLENGTMLTGMSCLVHDVRGVCVILEWSWGGFLALVEFVSGQRLWIPTKDLLFAEES